MKKNHLKELCLEITNRCPLECIHCSSMASPFNKEGLNFTVIKRILDDFRELGGEILEISGGEPLLHKDIYRIINYAKNKYLKVYLYTTGLKINKNSLTALESTSIHKLIDLNVDRFLFGLHGSSRRTHEKITKKQGSFSKTIHVIKKLKKGNAYVGIHFVPMKVNYRELEELCEIGTDINIDEFAVLRFVPQGRGYKNRNLLKLDGKETEQLLDNIIRLREKYKFIRLGCPVDFSFFVGNKNISKCKAGRTALATRADGIVTLCPAFKYKKILGDVKANGLKWIWKNSPVLNGVRTERGEIKACERCRYYNICEGKCLAQHFYVYGEINKGNDPWCKIAQRVYLNRGGVG